MRKITLPGWVKRNPTNTYSTILVSSLAAALLLYKITNLVPGANSYENESLDRLSSLSNIFKEPLNFIYYFFAKGLDLIFSPLTALRLTSVFFSLLTILLIRFIVKYWTDSRTANVAALIVSTSFWFLSIGRIGSPLVMPVFWVSLIMCLAALLKYTTKARLVRLVLVLAIILSLYTPLMIWVLISSVIVITINKGKGFVFNNIKKLDIFYAFLLISPLLYIFYNQPELLKNVAGLETLKLSPLHYADNFLRYLSSFGFKSIANPNINLGRSPLLDIFQIFMLCMGLTVVAPERKTLKNSLLIGTPVVYIVMVSILSNKIENLAIIIPIIFWCIALGFNELIKLWLKGFPRNPIGRSLGVILSVILITISGYYNIHKYFVVWPNNPEVKATHQTK